MRRWGRFNGLTLRVVYTGYAMNAVSIRGDWVSQTIDGKFPLIEWLGGSNTCGVFVSEISREGDSTGETQPQRVAIKLFPATAETEDRLLMWKRAASLSHPHLARILKYGRTEINGAPVVYVITELAEEVLAQILPDRALTADEAREMLGPILDALSYLHSHGFVHGHLKPSNILVIENEVKLSADGLIESGKPTQDLRSSDIHNAPEAATGTVKASSDIWALGVTLVEALTTQQPVWDSAAKQEPEVPRSIPQPFAEIVHQCLHVDPARRCTIGDVRAMLEGKPKPIAATAAAAEVPLHLPHHQHRIAKTIPGKMPLIPLIVGFVLLIAIIIGLQMHSHRTHVAPPEADKTIGAPTAEPPASPSMPAVTGGTERGTALNRVIPEPTQGALNTIHGTVAVAVRVNVNTTGTVTNAEFASHGPSAYFARLAMDSAPRWTFKPPKQNGQSVASTWLLRYDFRRSGVDVNPEQTNP